MRVYGVIAPKLGLEAAQRSRSLKNLQSPGLEVAVQSKPVETHCTPLSALGPALKARFGSAHPINRDNLVQTDRFETKRSTSVPAVPGEMLQALERAVRHEVFAVGKPAFSPAEKQSILKQVEQEGFLRMPPQEAINKLADDPPFVLELIKTAGRALGTLADDGTFLPPTRSSANRENKSWFSQTAHHALNIANLTSTDKPSDKGDVWKAIVYILTYPGSGIHLLPWHEKDLSSNYTPNNPFQMDRGIESETLKSAGIQGVNQLRLLGDVGKALGKVFWYDLLPHSAHFGTPALAHPEKFRWIQFNMPAIHSLPRKQGVHGETVELYTYADLRQKMSQGATAQDVENFVNSKVNQTGIVKTFDQQALRKQVIATVQKHLTPAFPKRIRPEEITPEQRVAIAQDLIQQGIWTLPRHGYNAWNFMPLVRGFNVSRNHPLYQVIDRGDKGDANGQMFPFTRFAFLDDQQTSRDEVIDLYISQAEFADQLGLADIIRVDQADWLNRDFHLYDPLPGQAIQKLTARFPDKAFVAERLDNYDKEPYRQVGVNAVVGNDWRKQVFDPFYFENAWMDQEGTLNYSRKQNALITGLHAFELHDQHMQPPFNGQGVSPFDPKRGGLQAGQARLLVMLFLNGNEGSNKPFYDIFGDEVGLPGQQTYLGGFVPGMTIDLTDKNSFYATYTNALTLRYGTPQLRWAQEAIRSGSPDRLNELDDHTLYAAKAQQVLQTGQKKWHQWYGSDTVVWSIESKTSPGMVLVVANPNWPNSRPASNIVIPQGCIRSGKGVQFLLNNPCGVKTQPIDAGGGLNIEQLSPSEVRIFYFE